MCSGQGGRFGKPGLQLPMGEVEASVVPWVSRRTLLIRLYRGVPGRSRVLIGSGCFGVGFGEGEPLITEVGDDLQTAAEGFDVGGQGAQFGGA